MQAVQVECTNCGEVGPAFYVTLAALSIAAIALYFSFRQHRELLRRLRAKARFKVTVKPQGADEDGVIRTEGNAGTFRVEIGIKNEGDLAAGQTFDQRPLSSATEDGVVRAERRAERGDEPHHTGGRGRRGEGRG